MSNTRKITVLSTIVTREGDTWKLREVTAVDERGEGIDKTLKTFEDLPLHQLIEVVVEKNQDPKYDEYMIRLPGSKGGGGGGKGSGLGQSVDLLRENVESLQTRVTALEGRMDAQLAGTTPAPSTPPAASAVSGPADDDIPF